MLAKLSHLHVNQDETPIGLPDAVLNYSLIIDTKPLEKSSPMQCANLPENKKKHAKPLVIF